MDGYLKCDFVACLRNWNCTEMFISKAATNDSWDVCIWMSLLTPARSYSSHDIILDTAVFLFYKIIIFPCVYSLISSVRPSWQRERACWHDSVIFENGFCVDMTFWLEIVCVCEWIWHSWDHYLGSLFLFFLYLL